MTYWVDVFTLKTFREFRRAGERVTGFTERRWKSVQRIRKGDTLICYVRGKSCWIGALEVVSDAFRDSSPIWEDALYPCRVGVKPIIILEPEKAIAARDVLPSMKLLSRMRNPKRWGMAFRTSPVRLAAEDGDLLMRELRKALGMKVTKTGEIRERTDQRYHDQVKQMLFELGRMEGRVSEKEYRINGERIDVAWKRIELGAPYAVFEVQIGGNFYEALAKLKHAWDKWNSRPFLVTTDQFKGRALEWIRGSFHEIQRELRVVDCDKVVALYEAVKRAGSLKEELGIS